MVQVDGYDWVVDEDNNPIEPLNLQFHIENGLNTDPNNIQPRE